MKKIDYADLHRLEEKAREIGRLIGQRINSDGKRWGFALMVFGFDRPEMTWISNANREDMLKLLDEFKQRLIEGTADTLSRPRGQG